MYLLYNLFLNLLALPFITCKLLLLQVKKGGSQRMRERFGYYASERLFSLKGRKVCWIHAVSVGETRVVAPLLKAFKQQFPEYSLVMSNVTETGHAVAEGIPEVDLCVYFPYDFSWMVHRALQQVQPDLVLIVETEIWPNFLRAVSGRGIPVVLVNGRISDRSFPRYLRLRFFLKPVLSQFKLLGMQSSLDAERIVAIGAPPELVTVTRNLKFDLHSSDLDRIESEGVRRKFHLSDSCRVWVAASTHAGEEEQVLKVFRSLLDDNIDLLLVLVPRHPERCRAVGELLSSRQIPFVLRSEIDQGAGTLTTGMVLLVDSIGEVLKFYSIADLIFVGGSLTPVGGHNVLEASLLRKPVLFGPHMHNFKEISRLLIEAKGGICVSDADGLYEEVAGLLADPEIGRAMGTKGYELLKKNRGATDISLKAIARLLEKK